MIVSKKHLQRGFNNFDFLRFFAAFLVFYAHSKVIFTAKPLNFDIFSEIFLFSSASIGVAIFFIISGFLISHSFKNSYSIFDFFIKRILRIFPALIVVIFLSIIIFGVFFTNLPFTEFIFHKTTLLYFQNCLVFRSYYYLPGVFEKNIFTSSINGSIWTIPYEFMSYIFLYFLLVIPKINKKYALLTIFISLFISYIFFKTEIDKLIIPFFGIIFSSFMLPFLYFFTGMLFYQFKSFIKFNLWGLSLMILVLIFMNFQLIPRLFNVFPLSYLVFYFAFLKIPKINNFAKYGDFSYGFYLYAFPIQQVFSSFFAENWNFYFLVIITFIVSLIFAIISWHLIEKQALKLKKMTLIFKKICSNF
jgi:peptidoglycan/LPS O-acetylase OafA/YrhL